MSIDVSEETILEALRQVPMERWPEVLQYLGSLHVDTGDAGSQTAVAGLADVTWSAAELHKLPRAVQDAVLRFQAARLISQHHRDPHFIGGVKWWTPGEIGRLAVDQRDILLEASAMVAAQEYRTNPELTAFDAFGEADLYGDSASSEFFHGPRPAADSR
jgi:hypothetical protein